MFEVEGEIPAKIGPGGLDLVNFIFVEPRAIQSTKPERKTERHDEKQGGKFLCPSQVRLH